MSSTNSTVVEQVDKELELPQLANNISVLPQLVTTEPNLPALQSVNTDSTLPTHHVPLRAYIIPSAYNPGPYNGNRIIAPTARAPFQTRLTEQTWFIHVEKYAPVIGIVIAVLAIAVTVVGIIVGVVVAVKVK